MSALLMIALHGSIRHSVHIDIKPVKPVAIVATWYGDPRRVKDKFHGRTTASGEKMNGYALTAAHRTFPTGTMLHITNPENGKMVVVRVNDKGPFSRASLDLSWAAARRIGMIEKGVARLLMRKLKT